MKENREIITKFKINFSKVVHLLEETEKKRREKIVFKAIRKKKFEGKAITEKRSKVR